MLNDPTVSIETLVKTLVIGAGIILTFTVTAYVLFRRWGKRDAAKGESIRRVHRRAK